MPTWQHNYIANAVAEAEGSFVIDYTSPENVFSQFVIIDIGFCEEDVFGNNLTGQIMCLKGPKVDQKIVAEILAHMVDETLKETNKVRDAVGNVDDLL